MTCAVCCTVPNCRILAVLKAGQKLGASEAGAFGAELDGLNGDGAADNRVGRLVDYTHGAAAEFADNFVTSGFRNRRHGYVRHGEDSPLFPYLFRLTVASA